MAFPWFQWLERLQTRTARIPAGLLQPRSSRRTDPAAAAANAAADHPFAPPAPAQAAPSPLAALPSPLAAAPGSAGPAGPAAPWSFRDTASLRPTRRSSSLLLRGALLLTGAGLVWVVAAPLGETIALSGKLEPSSKVREIQAPVAGVVDKVLVRDGQPVRFGEPLVRFDLRDARSRLQSARTLKAQLESEIQVYRAALGEMSPAGLNPNQQRQYNTQRLDLSSRTASAQQELKKSRERIQGLRASLRLSEYIAAQYDKLASSGAVSDIQALDARNRALTARTQVVEEEREIARLEATLVTTSVSPETQLRARIEFNRREITEQERLIREAQLAIQYGLLTAPAKGVVFDINVGSGSVVQASSLLLKVVPGDSLQARVYVPNSAIGFLQPGQQADLSMDTFPATDYGRIPAVIKRIGSDALTPEELREKLGSEAQGLYFPAVLTLQRQSLQAGRKQVPLQAGMSLTADVQLRRRRFINLLIEGANDRLRGLERLRT